MRFISLLLFAIFQYCAAPAQYKLVMRVNSLPSNPATDVIYVSGNFNNWNPKDELCKFKKDADGKFSISFPNVPANNYEYKFTKGSWETVETTADGKNIANRTLKLMSDTVLNIDTDGWSEGKSKEIPHSANGTV